MSNDYVLQPIQIHLFHGKNWVYHLVQIVMSIFGLLEFGNGPTHPLDFPSNWYEISNCLHCFLHLTLLKGGYTQRRACPHHQIKSTNQNIILCHIILNFNSIRFYYSKKKKKLFSFLIEKQFIFSSNHSALPFG